MIRYTLHRILLMIPVLIGVTLLVFLLQSITPGDPASLMLGDDATQEEIEEWREEFDLNSPILVQYYHYMKDIVLHHDFGTSYRTNKPITTNILERWPTTFSIALCSVAVSSVLGITLGIIAALNRNTWIDDVVRFFAIMGVSMPQFWFALLLILLFAINLKVLPVSGLYGPEYYVLPVMTIALLRAGADMRMARSAVLDNMEADFVRTARAKGQTRWNVIMKHILPNAMIPIATTIGHNFQLALGGTVVIETIFAIPGLGKLMIDSINQRDYPQLRGSVLLIALTACVINLLIDLFYAAVDPRVKTNFINSRKPMKLFKKKHT